MIETPVAPSAAPVLDASLPAVAADLLGLLAREIPFELWMLTRVDGDDWVVLQSHDRHYGLAAGTVLAWQDGLCARMARGDAPAIAPDVAAVPSYADAPIARHMRIGAYVGVPLRLADGTLFGTLAAMSPEPRGWRTLSDAQRRLLDAVARTLAALADVQSRHDLLARREHAHRPGRRVDARTGLPDAVAFRDALAAEQTRCEALGDDACVISVTIDRSPADTPDTIDRAAATTAEALRRARRGIDVVARTRSDSFAVLLPGTRSPDVDAAVTRLRAGLAGTGLLHAIGGCGLREAGSLLRAWRVSAGLAADDPLPRIVSPRA